MNPKISGSVLLRAEMCPASTCLPQVDSMTSYGEIGNVVHKFLEDVRNHGLPEALKAAPDRYRSLLALIDLDWLPLNPNDFLAEVSFAFDTRTGAVRMLGVGLGRRYEIDREFEIACTLDSAGQKEGVGKLADYKTGFADLGETAENRQLRFGALCIARAWNLGSVDIDVIHVPPEGGNPYHRRATLDAFDLDAIADQVVEVFNRAKLAGDAIEAGVEPALTEGDWCKYCPAFTSCRAKQGLVREIAALAVVDADAPFPIELNADTAPLIVERFFAMQKVMSRVERIVEEWASAHPVRLPNGMTYALKEREVDVIDPIRGVAVLAAMFGPETAQACVEVKTTLTKAARKRALQRWQLNNPGNRISKLEQQADAALAEAGALSVKVTKSVTLFKAKPELVEALPEVEAPNPEAPEGE